MEIKQHEGAKSDFEMAIKLKPSYHEALANLGTLLMNHFEDNEQAERYFSRAITITTTTNHPRYYNNRGLALCRLGRYEDGLRDFIRAAELNPMEADYFRNLSAAACELNEGHPLKAEADKIQEMNGYYKGMAVTLGRPCSLM